MSSVASATVAGPSSQLHDAVPESLSFPDLTLVLPNSGSTARDMLANERNFLTFFKLSCTLIVLGFTILLKFRLPNDHGHIPEDNDDWIDDSVITPIGYGFVAIGLISLFVSVGKYFKTQRLLVRNANFIRSGWGTFMVVVTIFCLACVVMVLALVDAHLFGQ